MPAEKGYVYILTNPSFPEYVKIGSSTKPVEERVRELNRTECTPFAFRIYAVLEVPGKLKDLKLHNLIDKLNPGLRSIDKVDGKIRDLILNKIHNFEINIFGTNKGEETVTAGGYDLNEINPKTMESKLCPNLYIIGEALNIDGFCGGFNLQNAWSTAFVAAVGIKNKN